MSRIGGALTVSVMDEARYSARRATIGLKRRPRHAATPNVLKKLPETNSPFAVATAPGEPYIESDELQRDRHDRVLRNRDGRRVARHVSG